MFRLKAIQAQPIMGYWDMENCRLDAKKTKQLAQNLGSAMRNANLNGALTINVYADMRIISNNLFKVLNASTIFNFIDVSSDS